MPHISCTMCVHTPHVACSAATCEVLGWAANAASFSEYDAAPTGSQYYDEGSVNGAGGGGSWTREWILGGGMLRTQAGRGGTRAMKMWNIRGI